MFSLQKKKESKKLPNVFNAKKDLFYNSFL